MPHIRIKGCKLEEIMELKNDKIEEITNICHCNKSRILFEYDPSLLILADDDLGKAISIEVNWIERSKKEQDEIVALLNDHFKNYEVRYIYFTIYGKGTLYVNGKVN